MAHPRTRPGGYVHTATGEKILAEDLDAIGSMSIQSVTSLLARLFEESGAPLEGFVGDDCLVSLSSAPLTLGIAAGWGFYYDTAASDEFGPVYRPIVVSTATTTVLGAHDATNPRIDIVCLAPAYSNDQAETRSIKDPSTSVITSQSVNKRSKLSYTLQVVAGTPAATPAAPATPLGYLKIAEVAVPATAGTATVYDTRALLDLSPSLQPEPPVEYMTNYVPGSGSELLVSATAPASASVLVTYGKASIQGRRRRYVRQTLAVTANATGSTRYDKVVADSDGTVQVVVGGNAPGTAVVGADQVELCEIAAPNGFATIVGGNLTDLRNRRPVGSAQMRDNAVATATIQDDAVTTAKLAPSTIQYAEIALTAAEVKALRATPKALVPAQGAGTMIELVSGVVLLDYGTAVYTITAAGDDMRIKYGSGAGMVASTLIEPTGFLDQAGDMAAQFLGQPGVFTRANCENLGLVLHNVGANEYTVGDGLVRVKMAYRVHATGW